jgi:hypothetical protein
MARIVVQAAILALLMLFSSFTALMTVGGDSEEVSAAPTRADAAMGIFERIGTWPAGIRVQDSRIMYLPGEIVIFGRDTSGGASTGPMGVWSFFEGNNTWLNVRFTGTAPDRTLSSPGFATDEAHTKAFFFGGSINNNNVNDLFIYDHSTKAWTKPSAANPPSARTSATTIYDKDRDCIWVFGGSTGWGQRSNTLFKFSETGGWSQYSPTTKPSSRSGVNLALEGDLLYLALGSAGGGGYANDLWKFNITLGLWTEIKTTLGIRQHGGGALVFDNSSKMLVYTLGFNYHSSGGGGGWNEYLNHTYRIDPSDGAIERVFIDPKITPRYLQAWSFDGNEILIFGGSQGERDVWKLNITTLKAEGIPPSTYNAGGTRWTAFDPDDGGRFFIISYRSASFGDGGYYSSWLITYFSLADLSWHYMNVTIPPTFVYHSGMAGAYDPVGNQFYLYGGYYSYTVGSWPDTETHNYFYDSFWRIDLITGTMQEIAKETTWPAALGNGCMVVDYTTPHRKLFLFGGQIPGGTSDAIAYYNITSNNWIKIGAPIKPPARMSTPLVMDPPRKGFYMFGGGENGSNEYNDLWFFHTDTEKWEQMSGASDPPSLRTGHGLSVNTQTGEVMVFGGDMEPAYIYLYRPGWKAWIQTMDNSQPANWRDHGQVYDPSTKTVYIWNGPNDISEVWRVKPILRTVAEQARIVDANGYRMNDVFPTYSNYTLKVSGYSDIGISDIEGVEVKLKNETMTLTIDWTPGMPLQVSGPTDWVNFPGTPSIASETGGRWSLDIPIEFTLNGTDGSAYSIIYVPTTTVGYTETRQTLNAFTLHTDIVVSKVKFSSDLQPLGVEPGTWLFSGTDLVLSGFQLSFSADTSVHPVSSDFKVAFSNQEGVTDEWIYDADAVKNLSVPITGKDGKMSYYYMNVTKGAEKIGTQVFGFKIDATAPLPPLKIAFKADSLSDPATYVDNDQDVYLTWGTTYDNGSGVKGVCYSIDVNLHPSQTNLSQEGKQIRLKEGMHTLYIWTVDKTDRIGPYTTVPLMIDTHRAYFFDPVPLEINVTATEYTVSIKVRDDLSGIDLDSLEYTQTGADRLYGAWQRVPSESMVEDNGTYAITMEVPLFIATKKNLVKFRVDDNADNGLVESVIITINTDPELATPKVTLNAPAKGETITDPVPLSWTASYIHNDELTFEITVIDPKGNVFKNNTGAGKSISYSPAYPGIYKWKVTAKSPTGNGISEERTFVYAPSFSTIAPPSALAVKRNETFEVKFSVANALKVPVNLTFNKVDLQGMVLSGNNKLMLLADSNGEMKLTLNATMAKMGERTLTFNVTDDYGRWTGATTVKVTVEDDFVPPIVKPGGDKNEFPIMYVIIAIVVLLLIIAIVVFIIVRRNRGVLNMKVEPPEEEEDDSYDLNYDPRGVVAKGSSPASAIGTSSYEHIHRAQQSNVMEIPLPVKKPEKDLSPADMEEVECRCGNVIKFTSVKKPMTFKCPKCGRKGVLEAEEEEVEELEELEELEE